MNKHLSALWVVSAFVPGCALSADDGSDAVAANESAITAGHLRLGGTSSTCGASAAPQLVFFGTDAAGHENYDFNTKLIAQSGAFCTVQGALVSDSPSICVRIKGSTINGVAFPTPGAFGTINVRSSWLQVVPGLLDNVVQVPVSNGSFSFFRNVFQPGPLSPRGVTGLTVVVTPFVTASGGTAGQPPRITADFSFGGTTTTLETVPNC